MKKVTKLGNWFIKFITTILATVFLIYGLFMLWDMYRTELKAFASYDLLQYRPNIENNEPPYLDDLIKINPDTKAWITIYNTNIDYPVMQGKDDWEYLNKNATGEYLISGSIYMSYKYSSDFSDPYTLIYGHHMENGSMFGDIDKFLSKSFFDSNSTGILILPDKAYDITIMAILETSAYDPNIFSQYSSSCLDNALYKRDVDASKVIALSTCDSSAEFARKVLLCSLTPRTAPLPSREDGEATPHRVAIGHPMAGAYWSLLNLIILIVTAYAGIRLSIYKESKLKIFISLGLSAISILIFILTEDLHKPIQLIDMWTPVMLILLILIYLVNNRKKSSELKI